MTAAEKLLQKALVASNLDSRQWNSIQAGIRDRAFFSAKVKSTQFLLEARTVIADFLANAMNEDGAYVSRAEAVSRIMQAARQCGISQGGETVRDPGSEARANVVIDTNAGMAAGYVRAVAANTYGARLAFPAQELVRIEERLKPRDWQTKWQGAGGKLYDGQRMIALKDDPIWIRISAFGNPYPPFDFNSGMGLEDVSYDEAVRLGVIEDGYQPPDVSPIDTFNAQLDSELYVEKASDPKLQELRSYFGDAVQYDPRSHVITFDGNLIHDLVADIKANRTTGVQPLLGQPSQLFVQHVPGSSKRMLKLNESNLRHTINTHVVAEYDQRSIQLEERELDMIGYVWRMPDSIERGNKNAWRLKKEALDGNIYNLVVTFDANGGLVYDTFFKQKK